MLAKLREPIGPIVEGTGMIQGSHMIHAELLLTLTGIDHLELGPTGGTTRTSLLGLHTGVHRTRFLLSILIGSLKNERFLLLVASLSS